MDLNGDDKFSQTFEKFSVAKLIKLFLFRMRNIEIKNCSTFFRHKHRTKARLKFEELCNTENLESRLEYAIKNEDSEDAKKLTKAFHELISVLLKLRAKSFLTFS